MKKVNNYWVDSNNNKWDCNIYTKQQAKEHSENLIDCTNCTNCTDCTDCRGCTYCTDCTDCRGCTYCTNCMYCRACTDCSGYNKNPNRYSQKGLGSNWANTCIYWDKEQNNIQVVCGCFKGNLDEFEKAVLGKYDKNHEYVRYIEITKTIMKMEKEK